MSFENLFNLTAGWIGKTILSVGLVCLGVYLSYKLFCLLRYLYESYEFIEIAFEGVKKVRVALISILALLAAGWFCMAFLSHLYYLPVILSWLGSHWTQFLYTTIACGVLFLITDNDTWVPLSIFCGIVCFIILFISIFCKLGMMILT